MVQQAGSGPRGGVVPEAVAHHLQPPGGARHLPGQRTEVGPEVYRLWFRLGGARSHGRVGQLLRLSTQLWGDGRGDEGRPRLVVEPGGQRGEGRERFAGGEGLDGHRVDRDRGGLGGGGVLGSRGEDSEGVRRGGVMEGSQGDVAQGLKEELE